MAAPAVAALGGAIPHLMLTLGSGSGRVPAYFFGVIMSVNPVFAAPTGLVGPVVPGRKFDASVWTAAPVIGDRRHQRHRRGFLETPGRPG
ncbi:hypothetical protein SALBM135S_01083 [Streptomyces alboniger]